MQHDEMLGHLGISNERLRDLLKKFHDFLTSLDEQQQQVVKNSLPSMKDATDAFGPAISENDLLKLFEGEAHHKSVMCFFPLHYRRSK